MWVELQMLQKFGEYFVMLCGDFICDFIYLVSIVLLFYFYFEGFFGYEVVGGWFYCLSLKFRNVDLVVFVLLLYL